MPTPDVPLNEKLFSHASLSVGISAASPPPCLPLFFVFSSPFPNWAVVFKNGADSPKRRKWAIAPSGCEAGWREHCVSGLAKHGETVSHSTANLVNHFLLRTAQYLSTPFRPCLVTCPFRPWIFRASRSLLIFRATTLVLMTKI